jgi:hypothetical protein
VVELDLDSRGSHVVGGDDVEVVVKFDGGFLSLAMHPYLDQC